MSKRLCLIPLLALMIVFLVGCKTTPPERIQKAIGIINAGVTDYVTHSQPILAERIQGLHEQMKAEEDEEKKAELEETLKEAMEYYKLGREIPATTQELEDWAMGKPLPETDE